MEFITDIADTEKLLLIIIAVLLMINILVSIFVRRRSRLDDRQLRELGGLFDELGSRINSANNDAADRIRQDINDRIAYDANENRENRREISNMLERNQEKLEQQLRNSLTDMQETNKRKIDEIRADINQKLDTSLNERLDNSFRTIGSQLGELYRSLGEISKLETGVNTLNKTLSNVKSRGVFGEMQLENILTDILPASLFDKNVVTKKSVRANRDAVEFAVRIPDKETAGEFMYLPIDSKFPSTYYDRIAEASDNSDAEALKDAVKELEQRVKSDARDIRDKYIDPPHTTDFAIMFLPTESLYAEVLRINGLVESCQRDMHVVITGPSTMAALLNSLSIGFRYMAVNRDSQRVLKLLSAIKTQYTQLSDLIGKAESRIELARKATDEIKKKTDTINKRLSSVEAMDPMEAERLLGVGGRFSTLSEGKMDEPAADNSNEDHQHNGSESQAGSVSGSDDDVSIRQVTEDFLD